MLANEKMKAGRFLRWHNAKRKLAWINERFAEGRKVYIKTATRITVCTAKHAEMFRATRTGLYIHRGKNWDCIDFCQISAK